MSFFLNVNTHIQLSVVLPYISVEKTGVMGVSMIEYYCFLLIRNNLILHIPVAYSLHLGWELNLLSAIGEPSVWNRKQVSACSFHST